MERVRRGRQPRRPAAAGAGVRAVRRGLPRPAVQHRQPVRVRRPARRPARRPPPHLAGDDAAATRGRARGDERARRGLRQHRRQRGGAPATADGRRVRRGVLRRADRGQPQPQGPAAGPRVRDLARVPARLRPLDARLRARRVERLAGRPTRLPAHHRRRAPIPAAAAAQHQQEVQPGDRTHHALRRSTATPRPAGSRPSRSPAPSRSSRSSATAAPLSGGGRPPRSTPSPTTWSAGGSARGSGAGPTSSSATGCTRDAARSSGRSGWPRRSARPTPR